jgi:hypothetical protein
VKCSKCSTAFTAEPPPEEPAVQAPPPPSAVKKARPPAPPPEEEEPQEEPAAVQARPPAAKARKPAPPPPEEDEEEPEDEEPDRLEEHEDEDEDRPARRRKRGRARQDGGISTLIPYTNGRALGAYYCGVFAIIPCAGLILGPIALILGVLGLRFANEHPTAKGKGHAIAGIVLGLLTTIVNWGGALFGIIMIALAGAGGFK